VGQILEPTIIEQGCSFARGLLFTYQESALNLTGYTAVSQIRKTPESEDIVASFTMDYTDLATGILRLTLGASLTAALTCGPLKTSSESQYVFDLLLHSNGYVDGSLVGSDVVSRPIKTSEVQIEKGVTKE